MEQERVERRRKHNAAGGGDAEHHTVSVRVEVKSCPNGERLATKHDHTLLGVQTVSNMLNHRVIQCLIKFLLAVNFYETFSKTIIKQGVQTENCLVTKQCWIVCRVCETFPVWIGL